VETLNNNATAIELKLPRFKIECTIPLNEPVMNIGMNRIFQNGFENMCAIGVSVTDILQKTYVEVNEVGTEAAAVTVMVVGCGADLPPPPIPFFANRPFLYLIKEKSTGAILFIGRFDEPS
jgi:serpin B